MDAWLACRRVDADKPDRGGLQEYRQHPIRRETGLILQGIPFVHTAVYKGKFDIKAVSANPAIGSGCRTKSGLFTDWNGDGNINERRVCELRPCQPPNPCTTAENAL